MAKSVWGLLLRHILSLRVAVGIEQPGREGKASRTQIEAGVAQHHRFFLDWESGIQLARNCFVPVLMVMLLEHLLVPAWMDRLYVTGRLYKAPDQLSGSRPGCTFSLSEHLAYFGH